MNMPLWKQCLLSAYYYTTFPYRRLVADRESRRGRAPVIVLFYHRVADEFPNDWTIANKTFERQMAFLRKNYDLISLEEAQRRIRIGRNNRAAVSITFDDGYADNCRAALPLLIKQRIPCTYFVTSKHVLEDIPFPHDVSNGQPLRPNTVEQVKALASAGIEIGAHTRTHPDLGKVQDVEKLQDEVVGAARELEEAIGKSIRYFAFPFGLHANLNATAFHVARDAGFEGVCSAYGGYNFPGDDPFHIQRIHADSELVRLKNWLSGDPRKRMSVERFQYQPQPQLLQVR